MRIENGSVLCADCFRDFLLQLEDLHSGLDESRFKPGDFVSDLPRLDVIAHHIIKIIPDNVNDAVGDPRRDTYSAEPDFFATAAHPRAILSRDQSSWKRALISSSSSASALAASGPSQRRWSVDPCPAASIIKPMM